MKIKLFCICLIFGLSLSASTKFNPIQKNIEKSAMRIRGEKKISTNSLQKRKSQPRT